MDLELHDEMKLAQLKGPAMAPGEDSHAAEIVDDNTSNACPDFRRNRRDGLLPAPGAFRALQEHRIEENSGLAVARFERQLIQNPRAPRELKSNSIEQQDKRSAGQL
jgi:hypothetical protein